MAFPKKAEQQTTETDDSGETASPPTYDRSIIEGSLPKAVWKLAAPTMVANMFGGLQGLVDHIVVGNIVGFKGNAAIGVSWQIFLVVVVFVSSIFIGMNIMVARFVGAGETGNVGIEQSRDHFRWLPFDRWGESIGQLESCDLADHQPDFSHLR